MKDEFTEEDRKSAKKLADEITEIIKRHRQSLIKLGGK